MKNKRGKIDFFSGQTMLRFDHDSGFIQDDFLSAVKGLNISKAERTYQCFGPAEYRDQYETDWGTFELRCAVDEDPGTTILLHSKSLVDKMVDLLLASGRYQKKS